MTGRATAMTRARRLRTILLDHGVPEVSIEIQDGRPAPGDTWNACHPVGVLSHHIASNPTPETPTPGLSLVKVGRSDLPGPLCNGTAGVDLVYRIICLGYANHPGYGGPLTLSGPLGAYRLPQDNGRAYLWGTEYEGGYSDAVWDRTYTNRRTGLSMTFREFMGRVNAGLCEGIWHINGHGKHPGDAADLAGYHGEHKTWAPGRKPDRLNYTTDSGRAEVRAWAHDAAEAAPTSGEDDMQLDDVINPKADAKDRMTVGEALRIAANASQRTDANIGKVLAEGRQQTKRIATAVDRLPDGATKSEIKDMLNNLDATINLVVGDDQPAA